MATATANGTATYTNGASGTNGATTTNPSPPSALPIIDLSPLASPDPAARLAAGKHLVQVCHDIGFCYLSNHGIPEVDLEEAVEWTKKFHDLPEEVKRGVGRREGSFLGFHGVGEVKLEKGVVDVTAQLNYGCDEDPHEMTPWVPEEALPGFHAWSQRFYERGWGVSEKVLRALALGLGLEEDYILKCHDWRGSQVVLKYYPPVPVEAVRKGQVKRLGAHTDFSSITVLFHGEEGGLEIESKDGRWVHVERREGCAVLNVGDVLQIWSNGYLKSTRHRVGVPTRYREVADEARDTEQMTKERYSVPIFSKPMWDAVLEPMPGYDQGQWKKQTFLAFYNGQLARMRENDEE